MLTNVECREEEDPDRLTVAAEADQEEDQEEAVATGEGRGWAEDRCLVRPDFSSENTWLTQEKSLTGTTLTDCSGALKLKTYLSFRSSSNSFSAKSVRILN